MKVALTIWVILTLVAFGIASWSAGLIKLYLFGVGLLVWSSIGLGLLYNEPSESEEVPA